MSLSMTSAIKCEDLHIVKEFKEGKVWMLQSIDGDKLVIKHEQLHAEQLKDANKVVKLVDPAAKFKVLTPSEHWELKNFARIFLELVEYYESTLISNHPLSHTDKQAVESLRDALESADDDYPFYKMSYMTLRNLETAVVERGKGNKEMVRDIVAALNDGDGMKKLGQVVAMDMFTDNRDRFYPEGFAANGIKIGPYTFNFSVCVNVGNVLLALNGGGSFSVIGLDAVAPNSTLKTFKQAVGDRDTGATGWYHIVDPKLRKAFAKNIVDDLEQMLHPKKSKWSLKTKLGLSASSRLEKGMVEGMQTIKNGLLRRSGGQLPTELTQRLAMIR
jgi:hypothetical protein